jgi:glycosyltransferase involved in cell wall biosynthesis
MNKRNKSDIVFIQPAYAHYREQLFRILSKYHDIHFLFERSINTYPGENSPNNLSYTYLDCQHRISCIQLFCYLIKNKPNVVISSVSSSLRSIVSFVYASIFQKRFILWIIEWRKPTHSSHFVKNLYRQFKKLIGQQIIRNCHSIIVGGSASKQYVLSLGKTNNDIFMAMQSANDIRPIEAVRESKISPSTDKYTFLYLSRIIPRKGLDILLKAFYLLRSERNDVSLLIGGDGPFIEHCQQMVESLQIPDVLFVGSLNPQSVIHLYEKSDIFVLPSYFMRNTYEAWGLVVNEAMSMALPVITTNAVGAAYDLIIDEYNGFIVKENDVISLHKAMNKILCKDLIRMGINSRLLFEKKNNFVDMADGFKLAIENAKSK